MDGIADLLGREVAGMPAWAWLVAIGGGLGLSWYMSASSGDSTSDDGAQEDGDDGAAADGEGDGTTTASLMMPPVRAGDDDEPREPADDGPQTNTEWVSAAVDLAVDRGDSPARAQTIATSIVAGTDLPHDAHDTADVLLSALGAPPDGSPAITYADPPAEPADDEPADDGKGDDDEPADSHPPPTGDEPDDDELEQPTSDGAQTKQDLAERARDTQIERHGKPLTADPTQEDSGLDPDEPVLDVATGEYIDPDDVPPTSEWDYVGQFAQHH